jgi:predicted transcriptional regulator
MARKAEDPLSRRERQIMDIIFRRGQATALEVLRDLPDPPGKTAVRTLLRILEDKRGLLEHVQEGQTYIYRPRQSPQQAGQSALQRVLETFFGGSLEQALAAHLSDEAVQLSPEEMARLAKLIQQARKKGQ